MTARTTTAPERRRGTADRRREREREILAAARRLLDARGADAVQVEDIAREAGLNKALIYRHFSGKDELFALAIVGYVDDFLTTVAGLGDDGPVAERLADFADAFLSFCLSHPAFVQSAMTMLRHPGAELPARMGEAATLRMGRAVATALHRPLELLREADAAGEHRVEDPDYAANAMYVQILGLAHLARVGNGVRELPGGMPLFFRVPPDRIRDSVRDLTRAALGPAVPG